MAASQVAQADDVDDIEIRQDEAKRLEDEGGLDEKYTVVWAPKRS